jgi:O-antigen/teichoic acid export membrane protein
MLFIPQIATQIYTVLDKTMIGAIISDKSEVGYYEQAQKVVRAALLIVGSLQAVMNSRIANETANGNNKLVKNYLEISFNFVWLLAIPMMFGMIAVADKFVPWYYGDNFEGVINILIATSPILVAIGLNGITGVQYLVQTGKQNIFTKSVIVGSIVNLILNLLLINKLGGVGAAIASVVAELCIFLYQLKHFKSQFKLLEIMKLSVKSFISGIVMFIAIKLVSNYLPIGVVYTLVEVVVGMVVYFILLLVLRYTFFIDLLKLIWETIVSRLRGGRLNEKS